MTTESAVSAPVRQLVAIFRENLADLSFPELDAATLSERAGALESTASLLASAERAATDARRAHAEAHAALKLAAERALGYARVYAGDDEPLLAQLDAINLKGGSQRRKLPPKRRTRRPKPSASNVAELPLDNARAAG